MFPDASALANEVVRRHVRHGYLIPGVQLTQVSLPELASVVQQLAAAHDLLFETSPSGNAAQELATKRLRLHNDGFRLGPNLPDTLLTYYGDTTEMLLLSGDIVITALIENDLSALLQALSGCRILSVATRSETETTLIKLSRQGDLEHLLRSPQAKALRSTDQPLVDWWNSFIYAVSDVQKPITLAPSTLINLSNRITLHGRTGQADTRRVFRRWWGWR
jgi:hypothetical protein